MMVWLPCKPCSFFNLPNKKKALMKNICGIYNDFLVLSCLVLFNKDNNICECVKESNLAL